MSMPGLGVMIKQLGGNDETVIALGAAKGKTIATASIEGYDALVVTFSDGSGIKAWDGGQSCCERRYMACDDDLYAVVGATLLGMEIMDGPDVQDDQYGECHEQQFLRVTTSKGSFTVSNHNEHNGYYGGFYLQFAEV